MTSLGDFCTAGTIRCNKIIATTADLPGGGGGGGDIDVDSITFDNTWKIYLDANSNFILENEAQNVISLSGDAHTGKVTLHDFDINDLANLDTNRPLNFTGDDLKIQSSNNSNIFVGGSDRINPRNNGASIGIGYQACDSSNLSYNVAIGYQAGRQEQGLGFPFQGQSVAVGFQAGESFQRNHGVALGAYAGRINQKDAAIACGFFSGNDSQGKYSIAVGNATGQSSQGDYGVAIGASAANIHQGVESLACGSFAGHKNLGYQSVALGHRASYDGGDFSNTIVINATGTDLDPEGTDRTYIKPIREELNNDFLFYNSISGEVTRSVAVNFTSNVLINGVAGAFNEVITGDGTGGVYWATPSAGAKPLFQVFGTNTSVATGSSGIYQLVRWNTPTIDDASGSFGWDSTNSQYRCPLAGNYRVSTLVQWAGDNISNRGIGMYIYRNEAQYNNIFTATTFIDVGGQPEYQFATSNIIIPCSQGDTIDIRSDAVSNLNVFYRCSHFNVEFIQ